MTRLLALAAVLTCAAGCFSPDNPMCAFTCGDSVGNGRHCPDDYECRADGYCHLLGSTGTCPFSTLDISATVQDLSGATGGDMSTNPADMSGVPADMSGKPADMASMPDMTASPDISSSPADLTAPPG